MRRSILLFCLCALLLVNSYAQESTSHKGPQLTFTGIDSVYDLGVIPLGSSMDYHIEIKNTGDEPLLITDVKCSSKNLQCDDWPHHLKAGKKAYLKVTYTAHGDNGSFKNYINIASNATPPTMTLKLTGANIPSGGTYMPSSVSSSKQGGRKGGR